jgi:hypothetical protein
MKEDELCRMCSMQWGSKQVYTPFQSGNLKEEITWQTWCAGRLILKWSLRKQGVHCIYFSLNEPG